MTNTSRDCRHAYLATGYDVTPQARKGVKYLAEGRAKLDALLKKVKENDEIIADSQKLIAASQAKHILFDLSLLSLRGSIGSHVCASTRWHTGGHMPTSFGVAGTLTIRSGYDVTPPKKSRTSRERMGTETPKHLQQTSTEKHNPGTDKFSSPKRKQTIRTHASVFRLRLLFNCRWFAVRLWAGVSRRC